MCSYKWVKMKNCNWRRIRHDEACSHRKMIRVVTVCGYKPPPCFWSFSYKSTRRVFPAVPAGETLKGCMQNRQCPGKNLSEMSALLGDRETDMDRDRANVCTDPHFLTSTVWSAPPGHTYPVPQSPPYTSDTQNTRDDTCILQPPEKHSQSCGPGHSTAKDKQKKTTLDPSDTLRHPLHPSVCHTPSCHHHVLSGLGLFSTRDWLYSRLLFFLTCLCLNLPAVSDAISTSL